MYCMSPGLIPEPHGYVFASSASLQHIVPALFRYVRTSGHVRVGLLVTTDATGQRSDKLIDYTLHLDENKPLVVAAYEHFSDNDISVAAQIAHIKANNPQFLYVSAAGHAVSNRAARHHGRRTCRRSDHHVGFEHDGPAAGTVGEDAAGSTRVSTEPRSGAQPIPIAG